MWKPKPINIWVNGTPLDDIQDHLFAMLKHELLQHGCQFVGNPSYKQSTQLGVQFSIGEATEVSPFQTYAKLKKPRGIVLNILSVDEIPDINISYFSRAQLVRKSSHIGIVISRKNGSLLWSTMVGNYHVFDEISAETIAALAQRIMFQAGSTSITNHTDEHIDRITWNQWKNTGLHQQLADAALQLGNCNLLDDIVPLDLFGSQQQVSTILKLIQRSSLGEGMQSHYDPDLRVMGITTSGGGKVSLSSNAQDGHIVPVIKLTSNGYIRAIPDQTPIKWLPASVETHENGMIYIASALINAGIVNTYDAFITYIDRWFAEHDTIDIVPEGLTPGVFSIAHFHHVPLDGTWCEDDVEVVYPNFDMFPMLDFPCGAMEAERVLLSALFQSSTFTRQGTLNKVIIAVLPGHGSVALYNEDTAHLIRVLTGKVQMGDVSRV